MTAYITPHQGSFYDFVHEFNGAIQGRPNASQSHSALFRALATNAFLNGGIQEENIYGADGKIVACEVLTRLRSAAGDHIDIQQAYNDSQDLGIAASFDRLTITNALKRIMNSDVPVTMNASPDYVLSQKFDDDIRTLAERKLIIPDKLYIEVLETPIGHEHKHTSTATLEKLINDGLIKGVFLDDYADMFRAVDPEIRKTHHERVDRFGHLTHAVKMDGKFVRSGLDDDNPRFIRSIERVKRDLPHAIIIAEFVQDFHTEAVRLHRDYGVDAVQGKFLKEADFVPFGKPSAPDPSEEHNHHEITL